MEFPAAIDWQELMQYSISDRLPNDVVLDILARLPVKSIARFKCVSMPWFSLFSHPAFILLHLKKATQGDNKSLLFRDIIYEEKEITIKWSHPEIGNMEVDVVNEAEDDFETDPNDLIYHGRLTCFEREVFSLRSKENFEELGTIQFPVPSPTSSYFLVGCINGLLCFAESKFREKYHPTKMFFLNPATKEIRFLPRYSTRRISGSPRVIALGFGYEPATDDYKVIRIRFPVFKNAYEAETYSLRKDCWTKIRADMISNCNFPEQVAQANVHGALHWMVQQGKIIDYIEDHILAFDIGKEELYRISLPSFSSEDNSVYFCRNISVYKEHLALFSYLPFTEVKPFDMWVMTEYGNAMSWTKVLHVHQPDLLVPLHFIDQNRTIMMSFKDWQLVLTDADFRRIRDLGVFNFHPIFEYVKSLVSPRPGRHGMRRLAMA